jgi:4-amino-4-deoxy-L-arabinose transferase-like glycosyltransferase
MSSTGAMASQNLPPNIGRSREILAVVILTLAGAVIRLWSLGRLGLVHFDEGIYALAGLWPLSPRGLQGLDPAFVAYAPPGYPILVGLSYLFFGVRDTSAILVSVMCGTATIPLVAWLSLRTFGRGAGAVASVLAAGAAVHVSFSRMALTDALFLLVFLAAIGQGQRFLERPNPARALVLGLCVGFAQLVKYNGWIAGIIVALAAVAGQLANRNRQSPRNIRATWGWGLLAILVAIMVYWPWFQFVETHGGYRSLLAHQRGYMSGISTWPGHWSLQLAQARALGGNLRWRISVGIAAGLSHLFCAGSFPGPGGRRLRRIVEALGLAVLCIVSNVEWWAPLGWTGFVAISRARFATAAMLVLGSGWLILSIMTPFYHPYARLWLPLHGLGWIVIGGLFVAARSWLQPTDESPKNEQKLRLNPRFAFALISIAGLATIVASAFRSEKLEIPSPLQPTDSLRVACRVILRGLPTTVTDLRLLCRPAVVFYASFESRVNLRIQPNLDDLLKPAGSATWCLLDTALTRQDRIDVTTDFGQSIHWILVRSFPTYLNLPTALDIDPVSCYEETFDLSAPLLLLRPGQREGNR